MRVLSVDDDDEFAFALERVLHQAGFDVVRAGSGREAIALAQDTVWDAVLLDLGLPDLPGLEVLRALVNGKHPCPVIVLSARDEAGAAAEALRAGAMHYITKPFRRQSLLDVIAEARERTSLRRKMELARAEGPAPSLQAVGESPLWLNAMDDLRAAAQVPRTPVLITGESGTGKELAASLLHAWSRRAQKPFISVSAACFSPSLLESELFGHEAGAFTGAQTARRGLFELASGGTLFLDEIGDLPAELQPKLLRVLEGHPFRRLGGERPITVDVRVVSATNAQLEQSVAAGRFRSDLYHRLRVVEVRLPPLRARADDCELLALHFVTRLSEELGKAILDIAPEALAALRRYVWPGNVRELRNAIERAIVLCRGGRLTVADLPPEVRRAATLIEAKAARAALRPRALDDVVREHVLEVYRRSDGNLAKAARDLGIGRSTLRRRLREYGVVTVQEEQ